MPIHFLAGFKETPTKEVNKSISFSLDDEVKFQVSNSSHDIEVKILEVIIPRK